MNKKEAAFWQKFLSQTTIKNPQFGEAWSFGGTIELADELAKLVLNGTKTATSSAKVEYEWGNEALPKANHHYDILLDGSGNPVAILMTTKVYMTKFCEVTPEHAYKEGEGDLTLKYWQQVHYDFWDKLFKDVYNKQVDIKNMAVVCEEFEVIYK